MFYVSQEKNKGKCLKERDTLLGSCLCYPLAGGELCNAASEILTVIKYDCKKFYGIVS